MSIAEEKAFEAYPPVWKKSKSGYECDINIERRIGYTIGYHQAEKDLALTWEDVRAICDIEVSFYPAGIEMYSKEYYEEVL